MYINRSWGQSLEISLLQNAQMFNTKTEHWVILSPDPSELDFFSLYNKIRLFNKAAKLAVFQVFN